MSWFVLPAERNSDSAWFSHLSLRVCYPLCSWRILGNVQDKKEPLFGAKRPRVSVPCSLKRVQWRGKIYRSSKTMILIHRDPLKSTKHMLNIVEPKAPKNCWGWEAELMAGRYYVQGHLGHVEISASNDLTTLLTGFVSMGKPQKMIKNGGMR